MLVEQIRDSKVCRMAIVPRGRDEQRRVLSALSVPKGTHELPII